LKTRIVQRFLSVLVVAFFATISAWLPSQAAVVDDPAYLSAQARLEEELSRLASLTGGIVGVSAIHIESERRVSLRGEERFPMASTYKIPIAVQLLTCVERGEVSLEQTIEVRARDLHLGTGTLSGLLEQPVVILSVRDLLDLMLIVSDNSATDLLLDLAGGGEVVTSRLRELGITGMEVSRSTLQLIADRSGFELPPEEDWTLEALQGLEAKVSEESRRSAGRRFEADLRDTCTPEAMTLLLKSIYRGALLEQESADLLLAMMSRCRTGENRLKGLLPPGTAVAHKTGTFPESIVNDAGIITLPGDGGHIAIAVFVKSPQVDDPEAERVIAHISRAIYDFFLFHPPWPTAASFRTPTAAWNAQVPSFASRLPL